MASSFIINSDAEELGSWKRVGVCEWGRKNQTEKSEKKKKKKKELSEDNS